MKRITEVIRYKDGSYGVRDTNGSYIAPCVQKRLARPAKKFGMTVVRKLRPRVAVVTKGKKSIEVGYPIGGSLQRVAEMIYLLQQQTTIKDRNVLFREWGLM